MKKYYITAVAAVLLLGIPSLAQNSVPGGDGNSETFRKAKAFYDGGMYSEAEKLFVTLGDELSEGYAVLCRVETGLEGFENSVEEYLKHHPESVVAPLINFRWGLRLFDRQQFDKAYDRFLNISQADLPPSAVPEFIYKKAYSVFRLGDVDRAETLFQNIQVKPYSDYTAPSQYSLGYIAYSKGKFREASDWFLKASKDARFTELANYYILECRFMEKDYAYVVKFGEDLFDKVPEDRQPHMARIMSESYLILGDVEKARSYYEANLAGKQAKTRADYFHAGSVLFAVEDWQGAVDNYSKMVERTDSLGQIANYQMGYSYIELKNKLAALDAFKEAAASPFNAAMQEDAFFNFAKLSFDLNSDIAPFNEYLSKYGTRAKGDMIYSYMAMAALAAHDYEAAVAAYDQIEVLDEKMQSNYKKAYFLRAAQLIGEGSYRAAVPHLKAAAYYADKRDPFNQLARYWTAEAYYRDDRTADARSILTDLYNLSALDGKREGNRISYDIAYTYFKEGDWQNALRWFNNYIAGEHSEYGADALTRIGDCHFFRKDYPTAIIAYERKLAEYPDPEDIYPYFRAGIACSLVRDYERKVTFLERVKQADPSAPYYSEAMYELGRAYVAVEDYEDAMRTFRMLKNNTVDLNYSTLALLEMGSIQRNAGFLENALVSYKEVVSGGTDYADEALLAIESIYQAKQDPEGYIAYVNSIGDKVSRTEEQKESVYFNAAEQIFLSGNWNGALSGLKGYLDRYPSGTGKAKAEFYIAECYRETGQKEKAMDSYLESIKDGVEGAFLETATLRYAELAYSLEHFAKAYNAYNELYDIAAMDDNKFTATVGMMRSAFRAREWNDALSSATRVNAVRGADDALRREADYVSAKSLLAMSRRPEAFEILTKLSAAPSTAEGAEAGVLIIQDLFDRGDFKAVQEKVYAFSESSGGQNYWLARAYIILGDSFAEAGNMAQARTTFESIRDGYTPEGREDDILDQVELRLRKL